MENQRLENFAPIYKIPSWSNEGSWALKPFVTSLTDSIYSFRNSLPPQLLGALFSRASRAKGDLREVLWEEYLSPILYPTEATEENVALAKELTEIIEFYNDHPNPPYNTKRAYQFFSKWLAQYGDDSIAQMVSTNLIASELSQPALKFLEDQRIGIAPIEKSTRYVDYSIKIDGQYRYYMPPELTEWGFVEEYRAVMNGLFDTYTQEIPRLIDKLREEYPQEKYSVLEKKAFDVLRGFLPMSTLSQVAFHGNAQAFKYMIDRCTKNPLGELQWFALAARKALDEEIPSLLLRLDDDLTHQYQAELAARKQRVRTIALEELSREETEAPFEKPAVRVLDYDPEGENKVIAALLFDQSPTTYSWSTILNLVKSWGDEKKIQILDAHFKGRTARWQKVGRAFENAFVRFEIIMNVGAYRDLHRHRLQTQQRQYFTTHLGYEVLPEIKEFGLEETLHNHMRKVHELFCKVESRNPAIAQYVPTMFHFVRFYQFQNLRQFFWEAELRSGSQGRPDYRGIEQEKFRLLQNIYPSIMKYALVDMGEYDLARRGAEERAQEKEKLLIERLGNSA